MAVAFFCSSAVQVLKADPVLPVEKSFWRLVVATIFVYILLRFRGQKLEIRRESLPRFAVYGLITAVHFVFYIASLSYTSPAHSLTIIYTSPVFVALFSAIFLKEKLEGRRWVGILVAAVGVGILAGFEPKITTDMLIGDSMALVSAVAYGLYSISGRRERGNYSLFSYAVGVYGCAALWMLPLAIISFSFSNVNFLFIQGGGYQFYALGPILALVALGVIPLGLGHTLYNAGLRRLKATYVNVIATQEVTLGILFTWIFNGQVPSVTSLIGAAVTLVGVLVVLI